MGTRWNCTSAVGSIGDRQRASVLVKIWPTTVSAVAPCACYVIVFHVPTNKESQEQQTEKASYKMNLPVVQRILGILLLLYSLTLFPPILVSCYYSDGNWQPFADALAVIALAGAVVWWPVRKATRDLRQTTIIEEIE